MRKRLSSRGRYTLCCALLPVRRRKPPGRSLHGPKATGARTRRRARRGGARGAPTCRQHHVHCARACLHHPCPWLPSPRTDRQSAFPLHMLAPVMSSRRPTRPPHAMLSAMLRGAMLRAHGIVRQEAANAHLATPSLPIWARWHALIQRRRGRRRHCWPRCRRRATRCWGDRRSRRGRRPHQTTPALHRCEERRRRQTSPALRRQS